MPVRHFADGAFAGGRPRPAAGHRGRGRRLIDIDEPAGLQAADRGAMLDALPGYVRARLFRGPLGLFLSGSRNFCTARHKVEMPTGSPKDARSSASVASAF